MKKNNWGDSPHPGPVVLGTMMWGDQVDEAEAKRQMDWAWENEIYTWDTAEMYTVPPKASTQGNTEKIIGNWIKEHPERREKLFLASKGVGLGHRSFPWIREGNHRPDASSLQAALTGSLERLQTDYLDLYYLHWPARVSTYLGVSHWPEPKPETEVDFRELVETMATFIQQGKIRHWGVSNETSWGLMKIIQTADEQGLPRPRVLQNPYSLMNQGAEQGVGEVCWREGLEFWPYSCLAMGMLTGKYNQGKVPTNSRRGVFPEYSARYFGRDDWEQLLAPFFDFAKSENISPTRLALGWVASRGFINSVIIGGTTVEQLQEDRAAITTPLPPEILKKLQPIATRTLLACS